LQDALNAPRLHPRDRWIARGASLALHSLLLLWLGMGLRHSAATSMVIFSVETVSGITPQGEGSGAQGASQQMTNSPANANPLAGGLHLGVTDAPVPPTAKAAKAARPRPAAAAPSLQDLSKRYENLDIGLKPRHADAAEEPSEGGMGNAHQAGTPDGSLDLQGAIAGRRYHIGDYSFQGKLPGESDVLVLVTVSPRGEVIRADISHTSGITALDQHALTKAREIVFDALPAGDPQLDSTGTVRFKFEWGGAAIP
jgi:TonB family protein